MRTAAVLLLLVACGCGRQARRDAAELDALLATGGVDRIEFLDDEKDKTNVLAGARAAAVLHLLAATNRAPRRPNAFLKDYASGRVFFYGGTNRLMALHYVPKYDAFVRGQYYFGSKGTNTLNEFFD
jgi:hypothetical protein